MEKRVFADRAEYLGDPGFVDNRIDELLDEAYIEARAREVDPQRISPLTAVAPGLESPHTTHYSIVDRWGNAVSNTYTVNWDYGSGVVVAGAGVLLNNEMDDFSAKRRWTWSSARRAGRPSSRRYSRCSSTCSTSAWRPARRSR
jgi:gamma-glutamyltranspeptidase/glutathione hydrolase